MVTYFAVSVVSQAERKEPKVTAIMKNDMLFLDDIPIASAVHLATQYHASGLALREGLKVMLLTFFSILIFQGMLVWKCRGVVARCPSIRDK